MQIEPGVLQAFAWGLLTNAGIFVGLLLGFTTVASHRTVAAAMALGAGTLLAASSVELAAGSVDAAGPVLASFCVCLGGILFSLFNAGLPLAKHRKRCGECVAQPTEAGEPGSGLSIVLGSALDALPEALVLGVSLRTGQPAFALVAAIALANVPEALSATAGMRHARRSTLYIAGLWGGVAVMASLATAAAFLFLGSIDAHMLASFQALGAGALIAMIAETMIPEAFHNGPRFSGILATFGFAGQLLISSAVS